MKQNQNIEASKHIEKLAKLIKITEAATDLVRALQTTRDAAFECSKQMERLIKILELPKFEVIGFNKYYFSKLDALNDGFKNAITWDIELKKWKVD